MEPEANKPSNSEICAVHEAGHAVAFFGAGIALEYVSIEGCRRGDQEAGRTEPVAGQKAGKDWDCIVCSAGVEAVNLLLAPFREEFFGHPDWKQMNETYDLSEAEVKEYGKRAREFLAEMQDPMRALADALRNRERITGPEAEEIIRFHIKPIRP